MQIPSAQGRAAEASAQINSLVLDLFKDTSFDQIEESFADLLQVYIDPAKEYARTPECVASVAFELQRLSKMLRKLEAECKLLKGGMPC